MFVDIKGALMIKKITLIICVAGALWGVSIQTHKPQYEQGEPIRITVSGLPGNHNDWLGLFYAYDTNMPEHVVYRVNTHGNHEGVFVFPSLDEAQEYEVRAFSKGSYDEEAFYPFSVVKRSEPDGVVINEVMAANAHTLLDPDFSAFSDWIELYNGAETAVDISGYKLSDKISKAKWRIPNGTVMPPKSYMIFWADDHNITLTHHHTNFKLKAKGEAVALFDAENRLIDAWEFPQQTMDISSARHGDTIGFTYPTPLQKNWSLSHEAVQADMPEVSREGGFYDAPVSIALMSKDDDAEIYYTTDGSYPTYGSTRYRDPIVIETTTVLRAMSVSDGLFPSKRITHTYFIDEETTLPTISIVTDEPYLWDDDIGIYVEGTNGIETLCGSGKANYMQEWKRPANIEYFDVEKRLGFNQEVHIAISGHCSRQMAQKSLSIKADDIFGEDRINYQLFQEKNIDTFKSFKLRNSGQDWWKSMFRDAMIQQLVKEDLDIDYQAYEPSVVFINGVYWGIHNIREKKNEDYLANNYPALNPKKVDILYGGRHVVKEGRADAYIALIDYIKEHNLSDAYAYDYVADRMDIDNYIDYQITQIYIANFDWPRNNIRYWKEQKEGAKWRWMMDDQDAGFQLYDEDPSNGPKDFGLMHNTLAFATDDNSSDWRNRPWATLLLRNLLKNETFAHRFVARFYELLETAFAPERVRSMIEQMQQRIAPEMPRHIATWGDAGPDYATMDDWYYYVDVMRHFANKRADISRRYLEEMFPE